MSERSSFTSEYIYDLEDYATIRKALRGFGNWLAPPVMNGNYEIPIVQGKIGCMTTCCEWIELIDSIFGVKTNERIRFVILCEGGAVHLVEKEPDGSTRKATLVEDVEEDSEFERGVTE